MKRIRCRVTFNQSGVGTVNGAEEFVKKEVENILGQKGYKNVCVYIIGSERCGDINTDATIELDIDEETFDEEDFFEMIQQDCYVYSDDEYMDFDFI